MGVVEDAEGWREHLVWRSAGGVRGEGGGVPGRCRSRAYWCRKHRPVRWADTIQDPATPHQSSTCYKDLPLREGRGGGVYVAVGGAELTEAVCRLHASRHRARPSRTEGACACPRAVPVRPCRTHRGTSPCPRERLVRPSITRRARNSVRARRVAHIADAVGKSAASRRRARSCRTHKTRPCPHIDLVRSSITGRARNSVRARRVAHNADAVCHLVAPRRRACPHRTHRARNNVRRPNHLRVAPRRT